MSPKQATCCLQHVVSNMLKVISCSFWRLVAGNLLNVARSGDWLPATCWSCVQHVAGDLLLNPGSNRLINVQQVAATSNNSSTRATRRRFVARTFNKLPKVEHVQVLATSRQDPIFDEKSVQLVASNRQLVEQTFNKLLATGNLLPETSNLSPVNKLLSTSRQCG